MGRQLRNLNVDKPQQGDDSHHTQVKYFENIDPALLETAVNEFVEITLPAIPDVDYYIVDIRFSTFITPAPPELTHYAWVTFTLVG